MQSSNFIQKYSHDNFVTLYDHQTNILETLDSKSKVIINHQEHAGITTLGLGYATWRFLFKQNEGLAIVTNSVRQANHAFCLVKDMLERTPVELKCDVIASQSNFRHKTNNNNLMFIPLTSSTLRGHKIDFLFLDECLNFRHMDNLWKEFEAVLHPVSKIMLSSRSFPIWFHEMYENAISGKNDFVAINC